MLKISHQSTKADWKTPTIQQTESFFSTVTQTDTVTSTIYASNTVEPTLDISTINDTENVYRDDYWEDRLHRVFPALLAFAIIGILAVIGSLIYLAYRIYQAKRYAREHHRRNAETNFESINEINEKSNHRSATSVFACIIPCLNKLSKINSKDTGDLEEVYRPRQQEPIRYEKSDLRCILNDDASSESHTTPWLNKLLLKSNKNNQKPSPMGFTTLPMVFSNNHPSASIDNLNVPTSSTFVPLQVSPLKLVSRSDVWLDPIRRRGIDELEFWSDHYSVAENQTIVVPSSRHTPPLFWQPPLQETNYYEINHRLSVSERHSIHIDHNLSQRSSTVTMQDEFHVIIPTRSKSESIRNKNRSRLSISSLQDHQEQQSRYESNAIRDESTPSITIKLPKSKRLDPNDIQDG